MSRGKIIYLTEEQEEYLEPIFEKAHKADRPGMVIAQVSGDHMEVRFIPYEKALQIQKVMSPMRKKSNGSGIRR